MGRPLGADTTQILAEAGFTKKEIEALNRPEKKTGSPLDEEGVDLDISTDEIIQFIRESRREE